MPFQGKGSSAIRNVQTTGQAIEFSLMGQIRRGNMQRGVNQWLN
jgi:hypothetical protein